MDPARNTTSDLLLKIQHGNLSAIELLLTQCRPEIRRFLELRMDPLLLSRVDPSDIAQEAILEIARRLPDFLQRQPMAFDVWIRRTAYQNLVRLRRVHIQAERRSVLKELPLSDRP